MARQLENAFIEVEDANKAKVSNKLLFFKMYIC